MLQLPALANGGTNKPAWPASQKGLSFDLTWVVASLRRQWLVIALFIATSLAMAVAYLVLTPARYTATSVLMLDNRHLQLAPQSIMSEISFDGPVVETQLEVLKSEAIATAVIRTLGLAADPEFAGNPAETSIGSVLKHFLAAIGMGMQEPAASHDIDRRVVDHLQDRLQVRRIGRSYVIEIAFQSVDPGKASRIANAVSEAYILDQMEGKLAANKRATDWLKDRVSELRQRAELSERVAAEFRSKNSLTDAGGKLLAEQQLTEINTQLVLAQGQTAQAKARLDRIVEIGRQGITDAAVVDSLQNPILNGLQQKFVEAARREAEFSARYGADHVAALNVRKEMQQLQDVSRSEMNRIGESYKSEYEIARGREQALQAALDKQRREADRAHQAQIGLRQLESSANAYRTMHASLLQRLVELTQQRTLPTTEARIITEAERAEKTHPRAMIVLGVAGLVGAGLGCAAAFAREGLDQTFRTARQVELALGTECVGIIPAARGAPGRPASPEGGQCASPEPRLIAASGGVARQAVLAPYSRLAETMRAIKLAVDTSSAVGVIKVIGVVSAVPEEGKSTVASNLALLIAHMGRRTLLIDGNLRKSSLTHQLAPQARLGLLEVLAGSARLGETVWRDQATGLHFLPAVHAGPAMHTSDILSSEGTADLLLSARDCYDYVIVDLPPLAPVVDARAIATYMDGFVVVIEWGRTPSETVIDTLRSAETVRSKTIGIVLNKANAAKLEKYEGRRSVYYDKHATI
jgi:succinoglycan biosynthesis transport protein ExoP